MYSTHYTLTLGMYNSRLPLHVARYVW